MDSADEHRKMLRWLAAASTLGVVIALGPMPPYGYYMLLRAILCATMMLLFGAPGGTAWRVTVAMLAVLYNPIFPIHLNDKSLWTVANVCNPALGLDRSLARAGEL